MACSGTLFKMTGPLRSVMAKRSLSTAAEAVQDFRYVHKPLNDSDSVPTANTSTPLIQTTRAIAVEENTKHPNAHNVPFYQMLVMDSRNENTNFLQYNLLGMNDPNIVAMKIKSDIKSLKPEVVYMQNIRKDDFTAGMKLLMKELGFSGYFIGSYDQHGTASFFKKELYVYT